VTAVNPADVDAVPDPALEPTLSVVRAGAFCGLGRSASYEAARRGELPTIRFGQHRLVVPTAALRRLLALDAPLAQEPSCPQRDEGPASSADPCAITNLTAAIAKRRGRREST